MQDPKDKYGTTDDVELLNYLLEEEDGWGARGQQISRRANPEEAPLSFAQQRLWVLDQLEPASAVYNIPMALRLSGELNVDALQGSLDQILERHEVLRATFRQGDEGPVQKIASHMTITLSSVDLQEWPEEQRESEAMRLAIEETQKPFNLAEGPLVRTRLFHLAEHEHVLLFTVHHIVADGWSMAVLTQELAALYRGNVTGQLASLPQLPLQFADFAQWQREWLQGEVMESQLSYWRTKLKAPLPTLQLPTDWPRPATQTFRGDLASIVLPRSLAQALKNLSHEAGVTLFMTLLAAFKTLLYRYSGQDDIPVGTPIAGRRYSELEQLVGFFVNTLVLRSDLSGYPSFRDLLARVREVTLDAYEHQDLPFEKLVEELQPQRDMSRPPLFQVLFVFQNTPASLPDFAGLQASEMPLHNGTAKFDLTLAMDEQNGGLSATIEYNTDLFRKETIRNLLAHFEKLLQEVTASPDTPISRLPLLTDAERRQIVVDWNATRKAYPTQTCLHTLVEKQVDATPEAVAVIFEEERLTYRELNEKANQLAHYLKRQGVGPNGLVGICAERSVEMVVGLLGILKAGAAYVPLDPSYPKGRLDFMLADANVSVLLTQQSVVDSLDLSRPNAKTILLDTEWETIARESGENPQSQVTPQSLAYVIYTSGSTGQPKGTMNSHRGICNRLFWMQEEYNLSETDRVLQKNPFSFDVSVWEFFWPLMTGAGLVVARPDGHKDSSYLVNVISEEGVTTIHFVPSMLKVFLEDPEVERCQSLTRIICSGEALPFELQERCFERLDAALHNLYGPTEAAIDVTYWPCERHSERKIVPIGYPIANTQLYILDAQLQPLPVGVPGELHIGGAGLAHGYLNRPGLTAEKFIPDPFSAEPGSRLYKTGDLARHLEDGAIEFLGRIDHQVKVRGFRIELGEIEAALLEHPSVQEAVVVTREDLGDDERLIAYLVSGEQPTPRVDVLRRFLEDRLPDYMIPSLFVFIESMPLSPNGKVARQSLPVPKNLRPELEAEYAAPATELERTIAEIWRKTLGLQQVGVHDNFFDLGGHSLLLVQVHNKLRQILNDEIAVLDLFRYPTIKSLVRHLSHGSKDQEAEHKAATEQLNAGKSRLAQLRQRRQNKA